MPKPADPLALREITAANRAELERLTVSPEQERYVAGVADSLAEAAATPDACPWVRGVYTGDAPVAFVMISDGIPAGFPQYLGPFYLWHLLVDVRWQGRGVGTATLDLVVAYLQTRGARSLLTSVVAGPASPSTFYQRYGFVLTGQVFGDEAVLELPLP